MGLSWDTSMGYPMGYLMEYPKVYPDFVPSHTFCFLMGLNFLMGSPIEHAIHCPMSYATGYTIGCRMDSLDYSMDSMDCPMRNLWNRGVHGLSHHWKTMWPGGFLGSQ